MRRALLVAVGLLLTAPAATALDVFPGHEAYGAHEMRILVRLPEGGALVVSADPPVVASIVAPGMPAGTGSSTPAAFIVVVMSPNESWHGLPGTVEVVLRRDDARQAVVVDVEDEAGLGARFEWPAEPARRLPAPLWLGAMCGILVAAKLKGRCRIGPICDSKSQ